MMEQFSVLGLRSIGRASIVKQDWMRSKLVKWSWERKTEAYRDVRIESGSLNGSPSGSEIKFRETNEVVLLSGNNYL